MTEILLNIDVEPGTTLIITSDNCTNQYISAHNFFDLQHLFDQYECTIMCILWCCRSGEKWSGCCRWCCQDCYQKCCIAQGKLFLDGNDCIEFLNDKFEACDSPSYSIKLIDAEKLNEEGADAR